MTLSNHQRDYQDVLRKNKKIEICQREVLIVVGQLEVPLIVTTIMVDEVIIRKQGPQVDFKAAMANTLTTIGLECQSM